VITNPWMEGFVPVGKSDCLELLGANVTPVSTPDTTGSGTLGERKVVADKILPAEQPLARSV
jgi:hypothetical protein